MAIKIYIPPQYAGNLVELDESLTGVADTLISPPGGARWQAVHNVDTQTVNIFAPENEVLRFIAEDGATRSDVHVPGNTGKLDENQSILGSASSTETSVTGSFSGDSSGTVTVTRGGVAAPGVVVPSFDGINYNGSALTAIVVTSTEGSGLEEGDVITFACDTNTGLTVTITVAEDDLQLAAGVYALKATTRKQILSLAAGESAYINVSKIEIQAAGGGDNGKVIAFFG